MGFKYQVAPELEFFLLSFEDNKPVPLPHDKVSYFDLATRRHSLHSWPDGFCTAKDGYQDRSQPPRGSPGQHELDFEISDALHIADGLTTGKYVIKALAAQHGLYATFLPKPFYGINGSGMHIHQQLINLETGKNAFVDEQDEYGLSEIGRHFIAGQLAHARSLCGILAHWSTHINDWCVAMKLPSSLLGTGQSPGVDSGSISGIGPFHITTYRITLRRCNCNPHLALAVMLRAGLDGIQRK